MKNAGLTLPRPPMFMVKWLHRVVKHVMLFVAVGPLVGMVVVVGAFATRSNGLLGLLTTPIIVAALSPFAVPIAYFIGFGPAAICGALVGALPTKDQVEWSRYLVGGATGGGLAGLLAPFAASEPILFWLVLAGAGTSSGLVCTWLTRRWRRNCP